MVAADSGVSDYEILPFDPHHVRRTQTGGRIPISGSLTGRRCGDMTCERVTKVVSLAISDRHPYSPVAHPARSSFDLSYGWCPERAAGAGGVG